MTGPTGATGSVARTIVGAAPPRGGTIEVFGERGPTSPREALKMQIASIPADRHVDGLALDLTIRENLVLPGYVRREIDSSAGTPGWLHPLRPGRERRLATEIMQRFGIKAQTSEALVSSLSGGNQQKVLLARWLQMAPRLVVLVEPTQGVDVHTRQEIYGLIKEYAAGGVAALVVSSDLVELCELCDRVMVLRGGRVGAELVGPDITEERIFFESYRTEAVSA